MRACGECVSRFVCVCVCVFACVCVEGGGVLMFLKFYMTKTQNIYDNQKQNKIRVRCETCHCVLKLESFLAFVATLTARLLDCEKDASECEKYIASFASCTCVYTCLEMNL